ncbi:LysE family translocator [Vibrio salinus]|uniref:LysE family translocator n=1 Tax=Vibrio salinus TaxID=2899784 RepID=UPI001E34ABCA|nr:LysE family translocator [Vibrio salinus]MCE0492503.1 LysE family translocator [Vibrio salinus]
MYIQNLHAFIIAITILTLTPGLDTALVIRNTSRGGVTDGSITSFGICCGLFIHATFSAIGISAILAQSASLFHTIKMLGAVYLIWLGISSIKSLLKNEQSIQITGATLQKCQPLRSAREGFLSNVLNPKTAVFYLAFLPQFMSPDHSPLIQSWMMAGIHFTIAMFWQCSLSVLLNSAKKLLKNQKFTKWMEGITGVILLGLGTKLFFDR